MTSTLATTAFEQLVADWVADADNRWQEGERDRALPADLATAGKAAGLFCLALPRALGGLELDATTIFEILERAAYADGAAGWCAFIGNATVFTAWLDPDVAINMLDTAPHVAAASVFAPAGRAVPAGDAFRVEGRWSFASGCSHSEWIQLGVHVWDGDRPTLRASGEPDWQFAYLRASEVTIVENWDTLGLQGTASHDIEVHDLVVPRERFASPMLDQPTFDSPLLRFGFWGLLPTLMTGFPLGVARRALDELALQLPARSAPPGRTPAGQDPQVHYDLGSAEAAVRAARALAIEGLASAFDTASTGDPPTAEQHRLLFLAMQQSMIAAIGAVNVAYRHAGTSAARNDSIIQRCLRDVYTARHHIAYGLDGLRGFARETLGLG